MRLCEMLRVPGGITAVVGGGGKTTLIWRLAQELSEQASVLITTTAHIRVPACETLLNPTPEQVRAAFAHGNLLAVGAEAEAGKLTEAPALRGLYQTLADYVLIEADGSRGLPLKAPAAHEPAMPAGAALTVAVAGMGCAGQTIAAAAHRPALYAALCGLPEGATVTPEAVARVLGHSQGQRKAVAGRLIVLLNQADTPGRLAFARDVATRLNEEAFITALQTSPDLIEHWLHGSQITVP